MSLTQYSTVHVVAGLVLIFLNAEYVFRLCDVYDNFQQINGYLTLVFSGMFLR
jgi:hypothetical protein